MARTRKYLKIVDLAQSKGGRLEANDPDLATLLGVHVLYKLPTYMWALRKKHGINVTAIRQGRKVIAYQFDGPLPTATVDVPVPTPDVPVTAFEPTVNPEMEVEAEETVETPKTTVSGGWTVQSK